MRRVLAPLNRDCMIAVVSESGDVVSDDKLIDFFDISKDYLYNEVDREFESMVGEIHKFKENILEEEIVNHNVVIVDYGVMGGFKMLCAIKSLVNLGVREISIASPVISSDIFDSLSAYVDNIYYMYKEDNFVSKDFYFEEIEDISLEEILKKGK